MANRRQFIQMGVAVSAVPLAASAALPAGYETAEPPALRLERFVFDGRFAEAVEIARHVARRGILLAPTSGDLTDLWYDDLDLRWKKAPMALAGMTTRRGLFVLETLAADRRMRVIYRGEHGVPRNGAVRHALSGPAHLIARATRALDAAWEGADAGWEAPNAEWEGPNTAWEAPLARALTQCPLGNAKSATLELSTPASRSAFARTEALVSWIIAPGSSGAQAV